jgi:hypothetical protein
LVLGGSRGRGRGPWYWGAPGGGGGGLGTGAPGGGGGGLGTGGLQGEGEGALVLGLQGGGPQGASIEAAPSDSRRRANMVTRMYMATRIYNLLCEMLQPRIRLGSYHYRVRTCACFHAVHTVPLLELPVDGHSAELFLGLWRMEQMQSVTGCICWLPKLPAIRRCRRI